MKVPFESCRAASEQTQQTSNRRQWLAGAARAAALAVISLFSGALLLRRWGGDASRRCRLSLPCRDCAVLAGCRLPRARSAKG